MNLLANACKYSPDSIEITIILKNTNNGIQVSILDKGIGMVYGEKKKIFDKYYRIPSGNQHNTKGFGIGLYYVKEVLKAHHASIEVESEPGKGSNFTILFPERAGRKWNQKTKLLLVEDDQSLGFLMTEFLASKGFDVTLCKDGLSGWKTFNAHSFQFAILDVMLPGLDGFSLAKKIREKQSDVPIILVTARSMKEDKIKGFNFGIDDYITKPFDEDELFCRIQAILNRMEAKQTRQQKIQLGEYIYEFQNQSLNINHESRRLTARENAVLYLLIQNAGQIVKRGDFEQDLGCQRLFFGQKPGCLYFQIEEIPAG